MKLVTNCQLNLSFDWYQGRSYIIHVFKRSSYKSAPQNSCLRYIFAYNTQWNSLFTNKLLSYQQLYCTDRYKRVWEECLGGVNSIPVLPCSQGFIINDAFTFSGLDIWVSSCLERSLTPTGGVGNLGKNMLAQNLIKSHKIRSAIDFFQEPILCVWDRFALLRKGTCNGWSLEMPRKMLAQNNYWVIRRKAPSTLSRTLQRLSFTRHNSKVADSRSAVPNAKLKCEQAFIENSFLKIRLLEIDLFTLILYLYILTCPAGRLLTLKLHSGGGGGGGGEGSFSNRTIMPNQLSSIFGCCGNTVYMK